MKTKLLVFAMFWIGLMSFSQYTYVPDDNFEQFLINSGYDSGTPDDFVLTANINTITYLEMQFLAISDLTGIEDFSALEILRCYFLQLTSLDLSQNTALTNLDCSDNQLTTLNIQNTALTSLNCFNNQLTSLDLRQNTTLTYLNCSNNQLTSLDLSQNTALYGLYCTDNQLTTLDVSQNTALGHIVCSNNQLTSLNLTKNTALQNFWCDFNQLESLNVKNGNNAIWFDFIATNNPNLFCINVDDVAFSTAYWTNIDTQSFFSEDCGYGTYVPDDSFEQALIDLGYDIGTLNDYVPTSNINTVGYLDVSSKGINNLTGIEDFSALYELRCNSNNLNTIDLSNNTSLDFLVCSSNNLSSLDLSNNSALTSLYCDYNSLNSLDLSNNALLYNLWCSYNNLSSLNISSNLELRHLTCNNNNLTSLDLGSNTALIELYCNDSSIANLDVTNNTSLTGLYCFNNSISSLDVTNNTLLTDLSCGQNNLSNLDVSQNTLLTHLYCAENNLNNLDVSNNTSLHTLFCYSNNLSVLDVSSNPSLNYLNCNYNNLSSLDISNKSSSLDISNNLSLEVLHCSYNIISSLDLSTFSLLSDLRCQNNSLTNLNVKNGNNVNFTYFDARNNSGLTCIDVDDDAWSTTNWTNIDVQTVFSEDCSAMSVDDFDKSKFSMYPNPVYDELTINLNEEANYSIINLNGQILISGELTQKENTLNVSNLSTGLYFLKVKSEKCIFTKKLIKQ